MREQDNGKAGAVSSDRRVRDGVRLHQAQVVEQLLAGGDALVLIPTGGGKSLCYQVTALLRPGTAIVVSPPPAAPVAR